MGLDLDIDQLQEDFEDAAESIQRGVSRGVERFALKVEAKATKWAPKDTGQLKRSARTKESGRFTYKVQFNTHYAGYVHERTELEHDQGIAKFLGRALKIKRSEFMPTVETEIAKELG